MVYRKQRKAKMLHTEKELELAKRYALGECSETQLNYIIQTEKLNKERVERLIDQINHDPIQTVAKLMLLYIIVNFLLCGLFSLFDRIK